MTVETKDLRLIKTDYGHKIKAVEARVRGLEKRVDWVEKLLWLSAGAVISWLVSIVLRSV
jgi:hypothetical protein